MGSLLLEKDNLTFQLTETRQDLEQHKQRLSGEISKNSQLQRENEQLAEQMSSLGPKCARLASELEQTQEQLSQSQTSVSHLQTLLDGAALDGQTAQAELKVLKQEHSVLLAERGLLDDKLIKANAELTNLRAKVDELMALNNSTEIRHLQQHNAVAEQNERLMLQNQTMVVKLSSLNEEHENLKAKCASLANTHGENKFFADSAKNQMEATRESFTKQVTSLTAQLNSVTAEKDALRVQVSELLLTAREVEKRSSMKSDMHVEGNELDSDTLRDADECVQTDSPQMASRALSPMSKGNKKTSTSPDAQMGRRKERP